jgi:lipopolysaccharide biosynthesis glycosyltransferase
MTSNLLRVFIGFDPVETIAWHVMANSIFTKSSVPIALIPLNLKNLKGIHSRPRDPKQSNEFSYTRFLVPYLSDFKGYAIFFDCDMMVRVDINEIFSEIKTNPNKAVYVVKHNYEPKDDIKYLNTVQYAYPRKNWSSVVLWNCEHPAHKKLTPEYVNTATGLELHRFSWLKDEDIGELDIEWNWLVGDYSNPPNNVKNVHWTIGGPYFHEYKNVDFSDEWFRERDLVNYCEQREMSK